MKRLALVLSLLATLAVPAGQAGAATCAAGVSLAPHSKIARSTPADDFRTPPTSAYPQPTWVVGRELPRPAIASDLDAFAGAGYCTIVVFPFLGPPYDAQDGDIRGAYYGAFWSNLQSILDEAAGRGMRIWLEFTQKTDAEAIALRSDAGRGAQTVQESSRGSDYPTSTSTVDYDRLGIEAADAYVDASFAEIQRRFPSHFGSTLIGFWDDESTINRTVTGAGNTRVWSRELPAEFLAAKGYAIDTPERLEMVFHGSSEEARKVRNDYWDVVSNMHQAAYARQRAWLEARGLQLIIQPLADEGQVATDMWQMGSYFAMQSGASVPGADMLLNGDDQGGLGQGYGLVMKQTSSAARLNGRVDAQHEPFGWAQPSIAQMRYTSDRMFARGITLVHQVFYAQLGSTPGDVSEAALAPNLFHGNVQWPDQPIWAQYTARLRTLLSGTQPVAGVMLVYPMRTFWSRDPDGSQPTATQNAYHNIATALIDAHRDYDIGWEEAVAASTVSGGRLTHKGRSFTTVVLPQLDTITGDTAAKLEALVASGGFVVAVGSIPALSATGEDAVVHHAMQRVFGVDPSAPVPAGITEELHAGGGKGIAVGADLSSSNDFGDTTQAHYQPVFDALARTTAPDAVLSEEHRLMTGVFKTNVFFDNYGHTANEILHVRKGTSDVYFVTNYPDEHERWVTDNLTKRSRAPLDTVLSVPVAAGVPQIWNPATGETSDAITWWRTPDGRTHVELRLPPQGGLAVVFRDGPDGCHVTQPGSGVTSITRNANTVSLAAEWPAVPASKDVPVECDWGSLTVPLSTTQSLADIWTNGPWLFTLTPFRPGSAGVPLAPQMRGPGSWTEPDTTAGSIPLVGITGTGRYTTTPLTGGLEIPGSHLASGVRLTLDLGDVRDIASLAVNGLSAGRRVWPCYCFDVTSLVHAGTNNLQIDVTNAMGNSVPGFGYAPARRSGLLDAPVLNATVSVNGTAALASLPARR